MRNSTRRDRDMSLRSSGGGTSREVDLEDELSPVESDDDMDALLASIRRKKPRTTTGHSSEGTEHTPLLMKKTTLKPRQRSRSISVSPTSVENSAGSSHTTSNEFQTPRRQPHKQVGQPRSGKIPATKSTHDSSVSASSSVSLMPQLPSPPDPYAFLSPSRSRDDDRTQTDSEGESLSEEDNRDPEFMRQPSDPEQQKQSELSQALKNMTNVLNKLVKRVEDNSSEIHALKSSLHYGSREWPYWSCSRSCSNCRESPQISNFSRSRSPSTVRVHL